MKAFIKLLFLGNMKKIVSFILVLLVFLSGIYYVSERYSDVIKIPIAIENLDGQPLSKQIEKEISAIPVVEVVHISQETMSAQQMVEARKATIAFVIPEKFEEKLQNGQSKNIVSLYTSGGFLADVAVEIVSRSIYEVQIPIGVRKHLKENVNFDEIMSTYESSAPKNRLQKVAVSEEPHKDSPIQMLLVMALILIGPVQLFFFRYYRQPIVMNRLRMYSFARLKLYVLFVLFTVALMLMSLYTMACIVGITFAFWKVLLVISLYEIVMAALFFRVKANSHATFMMVVWSLLWSALYAYMQLVGGIG